MAPPSNVQPPVLDAAPDDGAGAATIGTLLFGIATLAAILFHSRLEASGHGWWLWTAVTGTVTGLLFRTFASRRARVYRLHAEAEAGQRSEESEAPDAR